MKIFLALAIIIGVVGIAFVALLALSVYNLWAWPIVFTWFGDKYFYKYFTDFPHLSTQAMQVAILGFGMIYTLYWGIKTSIKSQNKDNDSAVKGAMNLFVTYLIAPWAAMFSVWLVASWFNL